jgi:membrane fusion protein, multidrug efflux system
MRNEYCSLIPHRIRWAGLFAVVVLASGGCSREPEQRVDVVPRVKFYTVNELAMGQSRRFSGKIVAADTSPLSFAVSGTVNEVFVSQGDTVAQGQVLATLDQKPMELAVEGARAQLAVAREKVIETKRQVDQFRKLRERNVATPFELDTAITNYNTAQANLRSAQADLDQKELDLGRTVLAAPSAGSIAQRSIDPFQELTAGKQAFVLQSAGSFKVEVRVPETLIRDVSFGQVVQVEFPTFKDLALPGRVTSIGSLAESGNAFPVEVLPDTTDADLRAGMTASVIFNFDEYLEGETVYTIPLSAVAIEVGVLDGRSEGNVGTARKTVPVFVVDQSTSQVRVTEIVVGDLRGNMLEVYSGLQSGDKVVSAGVPFLRDQMKVELWEPDKGLTGG